MSPREKGHKEGQKHGRPIKKEKEAVNTDLATGYRSHWDQVKQSTQTSPTQPQ